MTIEQPTAPPAGLLSRVPAPLFWLLALCAGLVGAAVLFAVVGLSMDAITGSSDAAALSGLAGALVGLLVPILYLKARRTRTPPPLQRNVVPRFDMPEPIIAQAALIPQTDKPPRRRLVDKLIDLNFKTTDGITRFFKFGSYSRGIVVNEVLEAELRSIFRRFYYWCGGLLFIGNILVGPLLPALFLPALVLGLIVNTNDIIAPPPSADRISFVENFRRRATFLPAWTIWTPLIFSTIFVVTGCWMFIHEALKSRRLAAIGVDYDSAILDACAIIVLFSFGITMMSTLLSVRRRHLAASGKF